MAAFSFYRVYDELVFFWIPRVIGVKKCVDKGGMQARKREQGTWAEVLLQKLRELFRLVCGYCPRPR
jgi:hypothetical protein